MEQCQKLLKIYRDNTNDPGAMRDVVTFAHSFPDIFVERVVGLLMGSPEDIQLGGALTKAASQHNVINEASKAVVERCFRELMQFAMRNSSNGKRTKTMTSSALSLFAAMYNAKDNLTSILECVGRYTQPIRQAIDPDRQYGQSWYMMLAEFTTYYGNRIFEEAVYFKLREAAMRLETLDVNSVVLSNAAEYVNTLIKLYVQKRYPLFPEELKDYVVLLKKLIVKRDDKSTYTICRCYDTIFLQSQVNITVPVAIQFISASLPAINTIDLLELWRDIFKDKWKLYSAEVRSVFRAKVASLLCMIITNLEMSIGTYASTKAADVILLSMEVLGEMSSRISGMAFAGIITKSMEKTIAKSPEHLALVVLFILFQDVVPQAHKQILQNYLAVIAERVINMSYVEQTTEFRLYCTVLVPAIRLLLNHNPVQIEPVIVPLFDCLCHILSRTQGKLVMEELEETAIMMLTVDQDSFQKEAVNKIIWMCERILFLKEELKNEKCRRKVCLNIIESMCQLMNNEKRSILLGTLFKKYENKNDFAEYSGYKARYLAKALSIIAGDNPIPADWISSAIMWCSNFSIACKTDGFLCLISKFISSRPQLDSPQSKFLSDVLRGFENSRCEGYYSLKIMVFNKGIFTTQNTTQFLDEILEMLNSQIPTNEMKAFCLNTLMKRMKTDRIFAEAEATLLENRLMKIYRKAAYNITKQKNTPNADKTIFVFLAAIMKFLFALVRKGRFDSEHNQRVSAAINFINCLTKDAPQEKFKNQWEAVGLLIMQDNKVLEASYMLQVSRCLPREIYEHIKTEIMNTWLPAFKNANDLNVSYFQVLTRIAISTFIDHTGRMQ